MNIYFQGIGYTGSTSCSGGLTCFAMSNYYSQVYKYICLDIYIYYIYFFKLF